MTLSYYRKKQKKLNPKTRLITSDEKQRKIEALLNNADKIQANGDSHHANIIRYAAQKWEAGNFGYMNALSNLKYIPVTIEEFITSEEYLGNLGGNSIWPELLNELKRMKPFPLTTDQHVDQILKGGAISTGKSYLGIMSLAYDIYLMNCFERPQALYDDLDPTTQIVVSIQGPIESLVKNDIYKPLRHKLTEMPFARKYFQWDTQKENELHYPNINMYVFPTIARAVKLHGKAIIAGLVDEVNFMDIIEESKKMPGGGGRYDQAEEVCNELISRRKSRFSSPFGPDIGAAYICSSAAAVDDYLERRLKDYEPERDKRVYAMRHKLYEVKPSLIEKKDRFKFMVGTEQYQGRIIKEGEKEGVDYPVGAHIEEIPLEFEESFRLNPEKAQRDIIGVSSIALDRFMTDMTLYSDSVHRQKITGFTPYVPKFNYDLTYDTLPRIIQEFLPDDPKTPRFVHIDLSLVKDRCGIAITKVHRFVRMPSKVEEVMPELFVEAAISIKPSKTRELNIADVRSWVQSLKQVYGLNIKVVSYDGWGSPESIQLLKRSGIHAIEFSPDREIEAYELFKRGLMEERILLPDNSELEQEVSRLQYVKRGSHLKVDHRQDGSKDISDAVAASIYVASNYRSILSNLAIGGEQGRSTKRRHVQRRSRKSNFPS